MRMKSTKTTWVSSDLERKEAWIPEERQKISTGIKLVDASFGECRFVYDCGEAGEAIVCGLPTEGLCSWCEEHRKIVFVPPRVKLEGLEKVV